MIPKGKLIALLLVFTAVGGVAATGAFTTVQADRTASVSTTGDSSALLQIEPTSNSQFASDNDNGVVQLNFQDPNGASGVNIDAETLDDSTITITNNGNDQVTLFAEADTQNGVVKFYLPEGEVVSPSSGTVQGATTLANSQDVPGVADPAVTPDSGSGNSDDINRYVIDSESNGVTLAQGESVTVGVYVSTDGVSSQTNLFDQNSDPVTITANQGTTGALDDAS